MVVSHQNSTPLFLSSVYFHSILSRSKFHTHTHQKSTFTAALIIAFLSLAKDVIGGAKGMPYQFAMFFSIIAIGFHLFATVIAARTGMICFRLSKSLDTEQTDEEQQQQQQQPVHHLWQDPKIRMSDFQRFLVLCEQLQLIGTSVFFPSTLFLLFYMFDKMAFAIAIYGMTAIAVWAVYRLGFWKISVLWHDLRHICTGASTWFCRQAKGSGY